MKRNFIAAIAIMVFFCTAFAAHAGNRSWAIVVNSGDAETAWNAMRVAKFARKSGNEVNVFFLGKGVESAHVEGDPFDVKGMVEELAEDGGHVYACKACLRLHKKEPTKSCPFGTLKILYNLIDKADKVLIF